MYTYKYILGETATYCNSLLYMYTYRYIYMNIHTSEGMRGRGGEGGEKAGTGEGVEGKPDIVAHEIDNIPQQCVVYVYI